MSNKSRLFLFLLFLIFSQTAQANNPRYFNERSVIRALQTISAAEATYQATTGNGNYGSLSNLQNAGLIDSVLAGGDKYGYYFTLVNIQRTATAPSRFYVTAIPRHYRKTGKMSFYIDEKGWIRGGDKNGEPAGANDPVINDCLSGNERCVILELRNFHRAQMTYQSTLGNGNFGSFRQLYAAGLFRYENAPLVLYGYGFDNIVTSAIPGVPAFFYARATPFNYGVTGFRSFYIDSSGVLRGADKGGNYADQNDPPIEE